MTRRNWREALKVANEHVAFAVLDGQQPGGLIEALGGPNTRFATWADVRDLLALRWLTLDHAAG